MRNVSAQSLARKIPNNANLNELHRTLFKLDIHRDLIEYFPTQYYDKKTITALTHLDKMDLPLEIARVVRKAWKTAGLDPNTESAQMVKKSNTVPDSPPPTQVCSMQLSSNAPQAAVATDDPL